MYIKCILKYTETYIKRISLCIYFRGCKKIFGKDFWKTALCMADFKNVLKTAFAVLGLIGCILAYFRALNVRRRPKMGLII